MYQVFLYEVKKRFLNIFFIDFIVFRAHFYASGILIPLISSPD